MRKHGDSKAYRARKKAEIISICESYVELLEAAKAAQRLFKGISSPEISALLAAIAKAEGETI